jgi:NAD(P)-dependent dehydrogenase (short-subunit alcohol dehydrogenase family)
MVAVVTGASRGIGYYVVQSLAKGGISKIIGIARNYKQLCLLKELCGKTEFVPLAYDFQQMPANEPQLAGLIKQYTSQIDILINNAGTLVAKPFEQISAEEIERMMVVNYLAPALLIKNLIPLLKGHSAHVVNISSIGGYQGSVKFNGLSHYSASKAALATLTECLAEEYKEAGIIFNALALGAVQTEMLAEAFPQYQAPTTPEQMGQFIADFAMHGHTYFNGKVIPVSNSTP